MMRRTTTILIGLSILTGACTSGSSTTQPPTTIPGLETLAQTPDSAQTEANSDRSDEVPTLAARTGASRLVVTDEAHAYLWAGGAATVIPSNESAWVWADSAFVYWSTSVANDDGSYATQTTARTFEGDMVCELDEHVTHVTERSDGSYVAGVEREIPDEDYEVGAARPRFAVDCLTGEEQAVEPVRFVGGEAEVRSIIHVGERTFTALSDAEGNADVLNEDGDSVNGSDYAGFHAFTADGSRVAYGDMSRGLHISSSVVSRTTSSPELLWVAELELPFLYLGFVGNDVAASQPAEVVGIELRGTQSVVVIDGDSGAIRDTIPTTLNIVHIS